jgi:predicted MFS family arabinose efflux permease
VTIVQRNTEPHRTSSAQSVVNAGTGPGLVAAAVLALSVSSQWRIAWMVTGVLTAGFAAAVLIADRRPGAQPTQTESPTLSRGWWADHRRAIIAATLMGAGSSAVWTYGRSHLVDAGTMSERGTVIAWIALGVGATAVIVTARPMIKLSATAAWTLSCTVMTVALILLAIGPQFRLAALLAYLMFGWGFTAATSSLIAWTSDVQPANSAAGTAMLFVALVFGQAIGATALGYIVATQSFSTAFIVASVLCAMAVATAARHRSGVLQGPTG